MEGQALIAAKYIIVLTILAMANNGLVELLVKPAVESLSWGGKVLLYASFVSALVVCAAFRVNVLAALFPEVSGQLAWWVGVALTAVPVARGSNYINDKWAPWAKPDATLPPF